MQDKYLAKIPSWALASTVVTPRQEFWARKLLPVVLSSVHIHVVAYWFHIEDIYRYFACHRSPNTLSRCREAK